MTLYNVAKHAQGFDGFTDSPDLYYFLGFGSHPVAAAGIVDRESRESYT